MVAGIVATEENQAGKKVIYLNALVHRPSDEFEGFEASGCVSTILTEL